MSALRHCSKALQSCTRTTTRPLYALGTRSSLYPSRIHDVRPTSRCLRCVSSTAKNASRKGRTVTSTAETVLVSQTRKRVQDDTSRPKGASKKAAVPKAAENVEIIKRGPGRPRKNTLAAAAKTSKTTRPSKAIVATREAKNTAKAAVGLSRAKEPKNGALEPRADDLGYKTKHDDLNSYKAYVDKKGAEWNSPQCKGTRFEYRVGEQLSQEHFVLSRRGRKNDKGIDLIGHWNPPFKRWVLKVLVSCKASKPTPAMIRELSGAYAGAPEGYKGRDVLAILASTEPATQGVLDALQGSDIPMAFLQMSMNGVIQQFTWNHAASNVGLGSLEVLPKHGTKRDETSSESNGLGEGDGSSEGDGPAEAPVSLNWMEDLWQGNSVPNVAVS